MKLSTNAILGALALTASLFAATTPAFALGACGRNGHRDAFGHCVFGGQNQAWCVRHTGHFTGHGPDGTRWCSR